MSDGGAGGRSGHAGHGAHTCLARGPDTVQIIEVILLTEFEIQKESNQKPKMKNPNSGILLLIANLSD